MELQTWKGDWGLPSVDPQTLTVISYCKMCGYDIPINYCQGSWNGKSLPVLTLQQTEEYLTTPKNIIEYLVYKDVQMDEHLTPKDTSEITAMISLITDSLYTALMYSLWLDEYNYQNVMLPYYQTVYKFPYSYLKAMEMRRYVRCMILARFSLDDNIELSDIVSKVFDSSKRCLQILSTKLGNNPYILGNLPSQLDAYMFAHLSLIRSCPMKSRLKDDLSKLGNLTEYTERTHKKYFPKLFRMYSPDDTEDKYLSTQIVHKVASVSAVVFLSALFLWYRKSSKLLINDAKLDQGEIVE